MWLLLTCGVRTNAKYRICYSNKLIIRVCTNNSKTRWRDNHFTSSHVSACVLRALHIHFYFIPYIYIYTYTVIWNIFAMLSVFVFFVSVSVSRSRWFTQKHWVHCTLENASVKRHTIRSAATGATTTHYLTCVLLYICGFYVYVEGTL